MGVTAGTALITALGDDVDRLTAAEPDVRADADDSVHQMRVATRRLRSVLRSYKTLLQRDPVTAANIELKWLADLLGVARDAEVRADRFVTLLDKQAADLSPTTWPPRPPGSSPRSAPATSPRTPTSSPRWTPTATARCTTC